MWERERKMTLSLGPGETGAFDETRVGVSLGRGGVEPLKVQKGKTNPCPKRKKKKKNGVSGGVTG